MPTDNEIDQLNLESFGGKIKNKSVVITKKKMWTYVIFKFSNKTVVTLNTSSVTRIHTIIVALLKMKYKNENV